MLRHAFQFVNSVIFLVGPQNLRSQRAMEKIGGVRAGSRRDGGGRESFVYQITPSTILFRDDTPFAYMNICRARFVSGHRLQPCRQRCKIVIPRRNGAISGKPDGPVAVAHHGRVGQYWRQNGTAEADVLIQTSPIIRDLLAGCVWRWTLL